MITLSNNKNFRIIKKAIPTKVLKSFQKKLNSSVNKIIKRNKINLDKSLSLDLKLLSLEEINHKYISDLYGEIKNYEIIKNFEKNLGVSKVLKSFFNKEFFSLTKAVRLDLSNNQDWNLDWHQESSYVGKENKFVFFWFPLLNKNDPTTGGLEIYDKFTTKAYDFTIKKVKNFQTQKLPNFKLKKKYSKEVRLNMGDLLVFDRYLFHKSVVNYSFKAKLSCVMSFYQRIK